MTCEIKLRKQINRLVSELKGVLVIEAWHVALRYDMLRKKTSMVALDPPECLTH